MVVRVAITPRRITHCAHPRRRFRGSGTREPPVGGCDNRARDTERCHGMPHPPHFLGRERGREKESRRPRATLASPLCLALSGTGRVGDSAWVAGKRNGAVMNGAVAFSSRENPVIHSSATDLEVQVGAHSLLLLM